MKPILPGYLRNIQDLLRPNIGKTEKDRVVDKNLLTVTTSLGSLNLISLAIPIFLELVFNNLIGTVSTTVLSGYSEEAVVATGTVNIVFSLFLVFFSSIATGASVVISNLIGGEQLQEAGKVCLSSVLLFGSLGIFGTLIMWVIGPSLVTWMNLTGAVYTLALLYVRIRALALGFMGISNILLAVMRCYGYPKYTVITGLIKNCFNLIFSIYAVDYAKTEWLSGVRGVALGSVLSEVICTVIVSVLFIHLGLKLHRIRGGREFLAHVKRILRIGIPTCISNASFTLSQIVTNSFAVLLGIHAVSAKIYFANILCYAYLFSSGVGNANALMAGRLYGAERYDHADRLNRMLVRFTVPVNLAVSLILLILHRPLLLLFTDNLLIMEMAVGIFAVDIITEQARAVSHVYEYSLRSTGDVTLTMIVTLLSGWVFGVGFAYVLSISCGLGLIGCFIGLAVDESIRGIFTYFRWKYRIGILKKL